MRENDFIDWIRTQTKLDPAAVPVGPGDDTAVVMCGAEELLVTVDQVLDGVHFRLAEHGPQGRRPQGDGAQPVGRGGDGGSARGGGGDVALPQGLPREQAEAHLRGLRERATRSRCPLVGGDVAAWDGPLADQRDGLRPAQAAASARAAQRRQGRRRCLRHRPARRGMANPSGT